MVRFLILATLLIFQGCATLTQGTTQEVTFHSNPEGVSVSVVKSVQEMVTVPGNIQSKNTGPKHRASTRVAVTKEESSMLGQTPLVSVLERQEEDQTILFSKDGYKPLTLKLTSELDSWFWGNIVFGGFIGSTTDSMSGAAYQYSPSQYFVTLVPEKATAIEAAMPSGPRSRVWEFVIRRYTRIIGDLHEGKGEDLSALYQLLSIPLSQEDDARRKIQALSVVYTDPAVFADHVIDLYIKP